MTTWNPDWDLPEHRGARALGIVSTQMDCTLEEAFGLIRETAENRGKTVEEIADAVLAAHPKLYVLDSVI
jgi:AmiR/NasT family two-component response regulator